jgi:hypothetical protein
VVVEPVDPAQSGEFEVVDDMEESVATASTKITHRRQSEPALPGLLGRALVKGSALPDTALTGS